MIDPAGFFEQAGSPADLPPAELGAAIAMNVKKAEILLRRNVALIKERDRRIGPSLGRLTEEHYTFIDMLSQWHDELFAKFCEDIELATF